MNTDYKVGDKVKVKSSLIVGHRYDGHCYFARDMGKYRERVIIIGQVRHTSQGTIYYQKDGHGWSFSPSMLEHIDEKITDWRKEMNES